MHTKGKCTCDINDLVRGSGLTKDDPAYINYCPLHKAAPDLLEACKAVVKYHRDHDSGEGELFGLDFVTTCIAAIAKAERSE